MARFRLARVLNFRSQLRRLRQLEADRLDAETVRLENRRSALRSERDAVLAEKASASSRDGIAGATLRLMQTYEDALAEREAQTAKRASESRSALVMKREEVGNERREERKLEHLDEAHRARADAAVAHELERLLDELVLARHTRGRREG